MKFSIFSLFISFALFCNAAVYAQQQRVKIEDFITEHEGFEENEFILFVQEHKNKKNYHYRSRLKTHRSLILNLLLFSKEY